MFASYLSSTSVPVIKYPDIKQLWFTLPGLFYDGSHHVHGQEWSELGVCTPLCSCFLVCAWCPLLTSCRTPFLDNVAHSSCIFPNQSVLFSVPQACTHRPAQSRQSFIEMLWACDYTLCQLKLIITPVICITDVSITSICDPVALRFEHWRQGSWMPQIHRRNDTGLHLEDFILRKGWRNWSWYIKF